MPVDNQTLIAIIQQAVRSSITPDYTGWEIGLGGIGIGLIAIMITVGIYKKQTKTIKKLDELRKTIILHSLVRIFNDLSNLKTSILSESHIVDVTPNLEEKIGTVKILIKHGFDGHNYIVGEVMKEVDFLRTNLKPELYYAIETAVQGIKKLGDETIFDVNFGSPEDSLQLWLSRGRDAIQKIDVVMKEINDTLQPIKSND